MQGTIRNYLLKNINPEKSLIRVLLPSIILLTFYFSEFVSKILKYNHSEFSRVSGVVKLIFEILILFYIYKLKRENRKYFLIITAVFAIFYCIGQLSLSTDNFTGRFLGNLYTLNGYLFLFILYFSLKPESIVEKTELKRQIFYLDLGLKFIFIVNALAIFAGLLFDLSIFKTYLNYSVRFGFNGLFLHASHSSYIYIIFVIYFYFKFKVKADKISTYFLVSSIVVSLLLGTKSIFLFIGLFLLHYCFKHIKFYKNVIFFGSVSIILFLAYPLLMDLLRENYKALYIVYQESGIITMLFSYRDISVIEKFIPYIKENWTTVNYFFGGAEFDAMRTEIEIIDFFWFFGALGSILYLTIFYRLFLIKLFHYKFLVIPIMIFFLIIILAGSFFTNAPVIPYFIIFFYSVVAGDFQTPDDS